MYFFIKLFKRARNAYLLFWSWGTTSTFVTRKKKIISNIVLVNAVQVRQQMYRPK